MLYCVAPADLGMSLDSASEDESSDDSSEEGAQGSGEPTALEAGKDGVSGMCGCVGARARARACISVWEKLVRIECRVCVGVWVHVHVHVRA